MEVKAFLRQIVQNPDVNYFAMAPDNLGLLELTRDTLRALVNPEDFHAIPASVLLRERVNQLEYDAHLAPRGSSEKTHFYIYGMQELPAPTAGVLLKTVEEAKYARFIFQCQSFKRKLGTIRSRCQVAHLPFLSKRYVLGTMKQQDKDWLTAERMDLYDGTLEGTTRALATKDTVAAIRRELQKGVRGLVSVLGDEMINSLVFRQVVWEHMTPMEQAFLDRDDTPVRRRIIAFLVSGRVGPKRI